MRKILLLLLMFGLVVLSSGVFAENVTITTYYPAPYGGYEELRAKKLGIGNTWFDSAAFPIADPADLIVEGSVSIGTTDPEAATLRVWNTTPYDGGMSPVGQDSIILRGAVQNALGNYYGGITWFGSGGRRRAGIASVMEHADSDHVGLAFFTQGTDGVGPMFESVRISYEGRVGIGTNTPRYMLDVASWPRFGSGGDGGRIFVDYGVAPKPSAPILKLSDKDDPPRIQFQQYNTGTEVAPDYSSWIGMAGGKSTNLAIMGGNLGIGTTTPGTNRLEVVGGPIKATDGLIIQTVGSAAAEAALAKPDGRLWLRTDL
ncbi:MAG: hypothetical protein U9Q08_00565 [Candidatus Omnitrophota bacterium]|nr:hypothetical protein [Candidatus Omnitrophota bacterium]